MCLIDTEAKHGTVVCINQDTFFYASYLQSALKEFLLHQEEAGEYLL